MGLVDKLGRGFRNVLVGGALAFGSIGGSVYARDSEFIRGDANRDEVVNIVDPIYTLNYLFKSGEEPKCMDAADVNDDGFVDVSDSVKSVFGLFAGGEIPAPYPNSGDDETEDELGCSFGSDANVIILNSCREINSPGNYVLGRDIDSLGGICFSINSSDVNFDGGGHKITHGGGSSSVAIGARDVSDINIEGVIFEELSKSSFGVNYSVSFNNVTNSRVLRNIFINYSNSSEGAHLFESDRNEFSENIFEHMAENYGYCVNVIDGSDDNLLFGNSFFIEGGFKFGGHVRYNEGNIITGNNFYVDGYNSGSFDISDHSRNVDFSWNNSEVFGENSFGLFMALGREANVKDNRFRVFGRRAQGIDANTADSFFARNYIEVGGNDAELISISGRNNSFYEIEFSFDEGPADIFSLGSNNSFYDTDLRDIWLEINGDLSLVDSFCDFDLVNFVNEESNLFEEYHFDTRVLDFFGNSLPDVRVQVYDKENMPLYENPLVTNDVGEIERQTLLSKIYTSAGVEDRSHYRAEVSREGYRNVSEDFDLDGNVDLNVRLERVE